VTGDRYGTTLLTVEKSCAHCRESAHAKIKDVARRVGVSPAAVSRATDNLLPTVDQELAERVRRVRGETGPRCQRCGPETEAATHRRLGGKSSPTSVTRAGVGVSMIGW